MGRCLQCDRESPTGESATCRLCWEQARLLQEPGRAVNLVAANAHGQQLFLANATGKRRVTPRLRPEPRRPAAARFVAEPWRQLALVDVEPDADLVKARALAADGDLIGHCKQVVAEHAAAHGWSKRQRNDVIRSLRLLSVLQDSPGARINATDVLQLPRYDANIRSTLDVLAAAGLLIDDRPTRVQTYFASKTGGLPAPMTDQLETWLEVMLNGSTTAPRQRSRDPQTAQIHILGIAPIIHAWAAAGHQSLAEITPAQVRAATAAGRVAPQLGRVRAAVPVHDAEGAQAHLHQPHPRHGHHSRQPHRPAAPGHRPGPRRPDQRRPGHRRVRRAGRVPRPDRPAGRRPAADRHRRRPPAPRRAAPSRWPTPSGCAWPRGWTTGSAPGRAASTRT